MLNLIKNFKGHIKAVVIVFALLIIQAYCELALPTYTSKIVDVGIANYGISDVVMDKISEESFEHLLLFAKDDEQEVIKASYELKDNIYYLKSDSLKEDKKLIDSIGAPMLCAYFVESSSEMSYEMVKNMPTDMKKLMFENMTEKLNAMGDDAVKSSAVKFAVAEYKRLGVDVKKIQMSYMARIGARMLLVALLSMASAICVGFLAARTAAMIGRDLRKNVFERVISFSNAEMDKFSSASLITRSTNDIQQVQMVSAMMLRMVMYAPIMGVGGVLKVLSSDTSLAWIIAVGVSLVLLVVISLFVVVMPKFTIMQKLVDRVNLVAREILTGIPVIRAFSREKHEEERFEKANRDLMNTGLFTSRAMALMLPFMMLIMNGISVLIIWFGGKGIDAGNLMVGDMIAFISYAMQIIMSFLMISIISIIVPRAGVAANRIREVLDTKTTILEKENVEKLKGEGVVCFDNVSFAYKGASQNVIEDISFVAKPGETTAIIGSTGCGKSTLVNLLPRFYDVTGGSITIDGVDIRDASIKELRQMIGFVPQKAVLFSGTISSNIQYGKKDADINEIKEAIRIAQSTDFVENKENAYESEISQGGNNVSGGQKQRLSIARAIAKKPKIYVFDDSFSALDFKTDKALRKELYKETSDSTVIIVAQRISTILDADQIIVLDDGKIAGIGTHNSLMENCEVYRQIATSQLSKKDLDNLKEVR